MEKRPATAKTLTVAAAAAMLIAVAVRNAGTGQTTMPFETAGEISPISVRVVNQGVNNGYPAMIQDKQGNLWCAWVSARQKDPLLPYKASEYEEGDMIILRARKQGKWGEPVILNTNFGVNFSPALGEDADGNIFVVWSSRRDGRYRLFSRRVGQDMSLGSEIEVLPAGKLEGRPDLTADVNGVLWLVSQSWRNGSQDIVFYKLENGGWRKMPDVAATREPEYRPRMTAAPDGSLWVAWDAYSKGKYHVRVRRFDPVTASWSDPEHVPGDGKLDAYAPDLAADSEGRIWVTYARNEVIEPDYGLRGRKKGRAPRPTVRLAVRENGTWWYPSPATGDEPGRVGQGDLPRVVIGEEDIVWLVWQTLPGHVDWKVTAAVYKADRWTGPFRFGFEEPVAIEGPNRRADQRPSVVLDPSGNALLAYERGRGPFRNRDIYLREVRLSSPPDIGPPTLSRFGAADPTPRTMRRAPRRMVTSDAAGIRRQLFMGDLHNHLLVDDGHQGSVDQLFHIHRDRFAMDFGATTSHGDSNKLLISELAHNDALAESLLDSNSFVTIPGFEWTQGDYVVPRAGHRHVIYETIGGKLFRPTEGHSDSIREFVDLMSKTNGLLFAHHITRGSTAGTDWSAVNIKVEPAVEICSSWGRFEYYQNPGHIRGPEMKNCSVQDAWKMGLRIGVIGGSDGHDLYGARIQGLTGIYATRRNRHAIFDALRKRHCYATTGEPIELLFKVNGHLMGSEIKASEGPVIEGEVKGTSRLLAVEVIKYQSGDEPPFPTVHRAQLDGSRAKVWWRDPSFTGDSLYYLRVTQELDPALARRYQEENSDRFPSEMAWSSPVWVDKE